jgi:intracellular sulfur oxidation DsrE/DsrF family protein
VRVTVVASDPGRWVLETAAAWVRQGDVATVVLVDAAAALARPGHPEHGAIAAALAGGVKVAAHEAALRRRGVGAVADGVRVVDLDEVAHLVTAGADKALWY